MRAQRVLGMVLVGEPVATVRVAAGRPEPADAAQCIGAEADVPSVQRLASEIEVDAVLPRSTTVSAT